MAKSTKPPKPQKLCGKVKTINLNPPELTVKVKGERIGVAYSVAPDATTRVNGKAATFRDLEICDDVRLTLNAAGLVSAIDARRDEDD